MKMKAFTKITSSILCAALTMQIGWALNAKKVNAGGMYDFTTVSSTNYLRLYTVGDDGPCEFILLTQEDGFIEYFNQNPDNPSFAHGGTYGSFYQVSIEGNAQVYIQNRLETKLVIDSTESFAQIDEGCTFTSNGISGNGNLTIRGTLKCDKFSVGDLSNLNSIKVYGTIEADEIDLSYLGGSLTGYDTAVYSAKTSFRKANVSNLIGVVRAEPDTVIDSAGGSFTLQVGNATKEISGSVSNQTAASLFDDPNISLGTIPTTVYYGQDYESDLMDSVSVATGYDKTKVYFEYSKPQGTLLSDKPTAKGSGYYVRAVAPSYGTYLEAKSEWKQFSIDYLSESDLGVSAPYFTVSGIVNGKYVTGDLVLTTTTGILAGSGYTGDGTYSNSLTLDSSLLFRDGTLNTDYEIALRRSSDDATTAGHSFTYWYPAASELIYDPYDPYVDVQFVDGVEASIEDGILTGDEVVIGVGDENLDKIYINGELYDYEDPDGEGYVDIELNSVAGKTTDYTIKATDLAGRSTTLSFTLYPNAVDPTFSVSVPATVYAGDNYDVTVKTNSDGEVSYRYFDVNSDTPLAGKPTTPGKYVVSVSVSETALYYGTGDSAEYTIVKRTPTAEIYVPDSNIGESYSPVVTTDSDGKGEAVIEYKPIGTDDKFYSTTKPSIIGSYTVRVTIPETSRYNAAVATSEFTIKKKIPAIVLGIGSPYVGTDYAPSVTTNSDAAAKAVIEYKVKGAADSSYTTTAPTTYGTYVVRVTIPETATFASVTSTTEFSVRYLEAPATAYEMTGTAGKNGYYVSGVELKAPAGYSISAIYGGTYTTSITYTDALTSVYLKRNSDNALTSAITIAKPKIDTQAPSFKASTGSVVSGSVMYVSSLNITVDDPNLKSLKVNGEPINLSADKDNVLSLSPGFGTKTFKITAEDEAGNISNIEFTLKAEWLESKVIIPDVVLPLEGNDYYNLSDGYWIVTRNTPEGPVQDSTVYSGGMPFYVEESGEYTFTKVSGS